MSEKTEREQVVEMLEELLVGEAELLIVQAAINARGGNDIHDGDNINFDKDTLREEAMYLLNIPGLRMAIAEEMLHGENGIVTVADMSPCSWINFWYWNDGGEFKAEIQAVADRLTGDSS